VAQAASDGRVEVGLGAGSHHFARFNTLPSALTSRRSPNDVVACSIAVKSSRNSGAEKRFLTLT
jgi:hypothetical protein